MKLLNIGCGRTFHPAWINIDCNPSTSLVQKHDFRKGLPFPDQSLDVCYCSHVLEHLKSQEAKNLMQEIFRVLKSGGIIRLVVPDLENIVSIYLDKLEKAESGDKKEESNYDWMMLELFDQTVRDVSGGEMGKYLRSSGFFNDQFVLSRIGCEAEQYRELSEKTGKNGILGNIKSVKMSSLLKKYRYYLAKGLLTVIGGKEAKEAFEEGWFRHSGEIHRWMYDRFSVRRIIVSSGFVDARLCRADESLIPDFNSYALDVVNGKIRKPDSLFIEATKP